MLEILTLEKGWLKKQLDAAEKEISSWPDWKRIDIDTQYKEVRRRMDGGDC